jgi:hypothetical protein
MARKVQASLTFRKNTPGERLGSIRRMSKYEGQLYSFQYTSYGPNINKPRPNIDKRPVLLLAMKDGNKVWKARNGRSYIYGFNLNYLPPARRIEVAEQLVKAFEDSPGVAFSYKDLMGAIDLTSADEKGIFRKYDVRGGKLRYLKQVNLDTYVEYLREGTRLNT